MNKYFLNEMISAENIMQTEWNCWQFLQLSSDGSRAYFICLKQKKSIPDLITMVNNNSSLVPFFQALEKPSSKYKKPSESIYPQKVNHISY